MAMVGNSIACRKLQRANFPKSDTTIRYRNKRGELKFRGSKTLKASQTYPKKFGHSAPIQQMLNLQYSITNHIYLIPADHARSKVYHAWNTYALQEPDHTQFLDYEDLWTDAELDAVEDWLESRLQGRASRRRLNIGDLGS